MDIDLIKNDLINQIDVYLRENKQEIVDTLIELMRIPSVRDNPTENNPYGENCSKMVRATQNLMEKHGFQSVLRQDLGYTYSLLNNGKGKTIGLYSHGDVVSVDGEWLVCKPFEPIIKDGFIFGRGCNDDKSGIVEMLYASKIIRDFNLPISSNILMFTGVNEETGFNDIIEFVKNEKLPECGLVIDGASYPCDFGERSSYKFCLKSKKNFKSVKNFCGGDDFSFNVVLPKCMVELDYQESCLAQLLSLTKGNDKFEIERNNEKIYITAKGKASPITLPDMGENAGQLVIRLLLECDYVCEEDKSILREALEFLADGYGKGFGVDYVDDVFGKLTCGNGIVKQSDNRLELYFDLRTGTKFNTENVAKVVRLKTEKTWNFSQVQGGSTGYYIGENNPYRKVLEKDYKLVQGENAPVGGVLFGGGTYARFLKNTFPIANSNKMLTPDYQMPVGHGSYHQPDEKLHIDSFIDSIKILVFLILGLDDFSNDEQARK